jgi:hypothetical protein
MSTDWGRFNAWSGLAAVLPEHLRHQAIEEAISAAKSDAVRTLLADGAAREAQEAVAELAIRAGEKGFFREALELVRVLPQRDSHGKRVRVNALAELLSTADDESRDTVLEQALRAARSINDYAEQALALAPLGGSLPADERRDVHAAALVAAHEITSPRNCAEVLVRAIPFLSGTQMQEAVLRAVTCLDEVEGSEFFRISSMLSRSLAPDVAATLIETKIMAAPKDEGEEAIQSALIRMFSNALSGPLLMKASKRALGCQNTRRRIQTLACLLPRLPLEAKIEFLSLMVRDVAKMAGVDGSDSPRRSQGRRRIAGVGRNGSQASPGSSGSSARPAGSWT